MGSKVGSDTEARMRPVLGSMATPAAWVPAPMLLRPSNSAVWAAGSMVSCTLPPLGAELLSRSPSRATNSRSSSPDSTAFCDCSTPVWL